MHQPFLLDTGGEWGPREATRRPGRELKRKRDERADGSKKATGGKKKKDGQRSDTDRDRH